MFPIALKAAVSPYLLCCSDAAGLLVAMARSTHQDADDQAPQEMHADQPEASTIHFDAQDQQHLQPQDLPDGYATEMHLDVTACICTVLDSALSPCFSC